MDFMFCAAELCLRMVAQRDKRNKVSQLMEKVFKQNQESLNKY